MAPDSDLSLIVEVLELVKDDGAEDDLEKALRCVLMDSLISSGPDQMLIRRATSTRRFHFSSLAHDNSALSSKVTRVDLPSAAPHPQGPGLPTLQGPAIISGLQTVSKFNKPASEADTVLIQLALWRIPARNADVTLSVNWPLRSGETGEEHDDAEARRVFDAAWRSFQVHDFGLFAGGSA